MRDLFRFLFRARNTLLFLALMGVAIGLLVNGNNYQRARAISSSNAVVGQLFSWRDGVTEFASLRDVNRRLAEENVEWRNRDARNYVPVESRFVVVDDSLRAQHYRYIQARAVNSTIGKKKNHLTLDRGSKAEIHEGMGVVGANGLVGVVDGTSEHFASVMSVLNADFSASVMLKHSRHFGLFKWDTNDANTASVVDISKDVITQVGDTVITRGGDGVFPEGVPVGVVTQVTDDPGSIYHTITIRLSEDMTRSAFVYVVVDLMKTERDTLQAPGEKEERP